MPVTITLATVPGKLTREDSTTSKTVELFGPSLAAQTLTAVSTVPDIKAAVARFGAKVRAAHPDASLYVLVRLAKGHRKPNGYDAAASRNGFGQDDFLHVEDRRTRLDTSAAPVAPKQAAVDGGAA